MYKWDAAYELLKNDNKQNEPICLCLYKLERCFLQHVGYHRKQVIDHTLEPDFLRIMRIILGKYMQRIKGIWLLVIFDEILYDTLFEFHGKLLTVNNCRNQYSSKGVAINKKQHLERPRGAMVARLTPRNSILSWMIDQNSFS